MDHLITQAERDAVMAPIETALSLPAQAYTSDAWFEAEVERIFSRRWMAVMFDCMAPAAGDAYPFEIFSMPLVAIRGNDGGLRVFHNICPYDGCLAVRHPLTAAPHIDVLYHGWRYDLEGQLIAAPYWNGDPDCGPEGLGNRDVNLAPVRTEVRFGTVFINLDGNAGDIDAWMRPWVETVGRHFAINNLAPAIDADGDPLIEDRTVAANWKTYQENASINILHEAFTHAIYDKSPEVPRVSEARVPTFETFIDDCLVAFSHGRDQSGETYDEMRLPMAGHDPDRQPDVGYFSTLYPNINVPLLDAMVKVNVVIPIAPGETRLLHLRFYRPEALAADNFQDEEKALDVVFDIIHKEDQAAIEAVQRARSSPKWRQHYYAPLWDGLHHRFNQLVIEDMER
jgi:choline monooxygenase